MIYRRLVGSVLLVEGYIGPSAGSAANILGNRGLPPPPRDRNLQLNPF